MKKKKNQKQNQPKPSVWMFSFGIFSIDTSSRLLMPQF